MVCLFEIQNINSLFFSSNYLAGDMVRHAKEWKSLPTRYHCSAGNITGKK
jgi:hypothetical protein